MVPVGWLSDLPAIASSGEAGGIAQKAIFYRPPYKHWVKYILNFSFEHLTLVSFEHRYSGFVFIKAES